LNSGSPEPQLAPPH